MENIEQQPTRPAIVPGRLGLAMLAVSLLIIAVFLFSPPVTVFDKTHAIGYAVCHQLPGRTLTIAGQKLPLCARCTGIYLGALFGFGALWALGRKHTFDLPPLRILLPLIGFIGLLGIDGVNSYLSFFPGAPRLYEPQNWLRLTTGTLHGLAMSALVFPVLMQSLWQRGQREPVIRNYKEFGLLLAGSLLIIGLVWAQIPVLLYPVAVLSTLGVLLMLGAANTMLVLVLSRREGAAVHTREAVLPATMGLALAFLEIGGIGWVRDMLTHAMSLPM